MAWVRERTIPTPSDWRLSAKLAPTFANSCCHVVSMTDPYGRILGFLDRSRYFFFQAAPQLYSQGGSCRFDCTDTLFGAAQQCCSLTRYLGLLNNVASWHVIWDCSTMLLLDTLFGTAQQCCSLTRYLGLLNSIAPCSCSHLIPFLHPTSHHAALNLLFSKSCNRTLYCLMANLTSQYLHVQFMQRSCYMQSVDL
jgi:hypothetical protein